MCGDNKGHNDQLQELRITKEALNPDNTIITVKHGGGSMASSGWRMI